MSCQSLIPSKFLMTCQWIKLLLILAGLNNSNRFNSRLLLGQSLLSLSKSWRNCQNLCYGLMMTPSFPSTELTRTRINSPLRILPTTPTWRNTMLHTMSMSNLGIAIKLQGHIKLCQINNCMTQKLRCSSWSTRIRNSLQSLLIRILSINSLTRVCMLVIHKVVILISFLIPWEYLRLMLAQDQMRTDAQFSLSMFFLEVLTSWICDSISQTVLLLCMKVVILSTQNSARRIIFLFLLEIHLPLL